VDDAEHPDESKQEAKASNTEIAQPPAPPPQQPPAGADAGGAGDNPQPAQPILVRIVGGDDLEPFEQQSLDISRRTYWVAFLGLWFALAAAVFVGVQDFEMTKQTQILASQSEGANAGALMDEMNTRRQLDIAQKQMEALQNQVATMHHNFAVEQQPFIWFTDEPATISWDSNKKAVGWTSHITNFGKSPAGYHIDKVLEVGPDAMQEMAKYKMEPINKMTPFLNVLPQGKSDYFTSWNYTTTEQFYLDAMKHDAWVVMFGTLASYDLSGKLHLKDFCAIHYINGSIGVCDYKHKIKQGK
jgi:hypothetical protein